MPELMKAAVLERQGSPVFSEAVMPTAVAGFCSIDVLFAGLNPIDLQLSESASGPFPLIPGREGVGRLNGKNVYFTAVPGNFGTMAEKSICNPETAFDIPDGVDPPTALALGIAGLTAWLALTECGQLNRGDTVLVLGASGAVGSLAIQAARENGAGRIIAVARSKEGLTKSIALGADETICLQGMELSELTEALKAASRGKLDLILDPLWGMPAIAALNAATTGGRLVQIGNSAAKEFNFNPALLRGKLTSIRGFSSGVLPLEVRRQAFARLCNLAKGGQLSTATKIFSLSSVEDAWLEQAASPHAKICLSML